MNLISVFCNLLFFNLFLKVRAAKGEHVVGVSVCDLDGCVPGIIPSLALLQGWKMLIYMLVYIQPGC